MSFLSPLENRHNHCTHFFVYLCHIKPIYSDIAITQSSYNKDKESSSIKVHQQFSHEE